MYNWVRGFKFYWRKKSVLRAIVQRANNGRVNNGITPDTGTKSSLREFSRFDMSTSDSDPSRGSLFVGVGKEGEGVELAQCAGQRPTLP